MFALGLAIFEQLPIALLLTAVWSLHPIHTEAVTNIVGRADMLAAFGVLAALFCHRRALGTTGRARAAWLAGIALAMTVGMFSKESAIVGLAVIPLYDFTFGRSASWRSRVPSYTALAVPCLAFLIARASVFAGAPVAPFPYVDNPLIGAGFFAARLTAFKVTGKYLLLLVWPARLSYDYSYNEISVFNWNLSAWEDWKSLIALLVCVAALIFALRSYRNRKPTFLFILFFLVTLAPASNIILIVGTIMGERLLYLPSVAFAAFVAYALFAIARRLPGRLSTPHARAAGLTAILLALAARTLARNGDWSEAGQLWNSGAEAAPGSFKIHLTLAKTLALLPSKDWPRIVAETDRGLTIIDKLPPPENVGSAYHDAAITYRNVGDASSGNSASNPIPGTDAAYWYRKSLAALLRCEKIELAQDAKVQLFNAKRGIAGVTTLPSALYLQLGLTYTSLSDPRALAAYERGRTLDPNPDLLEHLADAYLAIGDRRKAVAALVEAVALDPSRATLTSKIMQIYGEIDPGGCAVEGAGGQTTLNLNCPLVHTDICAASRNIMAGFARARQTFEWNAIRRGAVEDLGCSPELLK